MQLCFSFVAKLSTKMQNETQFLINFIVKINIKKFQQFFKTDFSTPLTLELANDVYFLFALFREHPGSKC